MTRRSSVRAQARRIYRDSAQAKAADPPSLRSGAASLTERARALYEDSAVPVREIARLAGVTERTIYKYAAKHAWKPRYRWAQNRGWRARATFAPAKGAGARFIRREDKGRPFATGIKATDPEAAARAAAECRRAQALASQAQAEAEDERRFEDYMRAGAAVNRALDQLQRYGDKQTKLPPAQRAAADDPLLDGLRMSVDAAMDWWQASGREWREGGAG
jgi:predicted transcriptional regulator